MTSAELKKKFTPSIVDGGVVNDGAMVPFKVVNESDYDIMGFTKSCSCIGEMKATARDITGNIPAVYKETNQELYKVDGKYVQKINQGAVVKWYNPTTNTWLEDPTEVEGPFPAYLFSQGVVVRMIQEGVPEFIVKDSGEIEDNPERLKFTLPMKFWVLKNAQ